jgi:hypothetical protein
VCLQVLHLFIAQSRRKIGAGDHPRPQYFKTGGVSFIPLPPPKKNKLLVFETVYVILIMYLQLFIKIKILVFETVYIILALYLQLFIAILITTFFAHI